MKFMRSNNFGVYKFKILLQYLCLHQLLLSAFGTNDIILIGNETASYQTRTAHCAEKAIVVPVAVFEWDEFCATNSWKEIKWGYKIQLCIKLLWNQHKKYVEKNIINNIVIVHLKLIYFFHFNVRHD